MFTIFIHNIHLIIAILYPSFSFVHFFSLAAVTFDTGMNLFDMYQSSSVFVNVRKLLSKISIAHVAAANSHKNLLRITNMLEDFEMDESFIVK